MFANSLVAILPIFLLISIGVLVSKFKILNRKEASILTKLIINVAVPANVVYGFMNNFDRGMIDKYIAYIAVGFVSMSLTYVVARLFIKIFKICKSRRGAFSIAFAFSNSVFIGFPVAHVLFGDAGTIYAVLFYLCNTTMFWTIGYFGLGKDSMNGQKSKTPIKDALKKLTSPPIISIFITVFLIMIGVRLPKFAMDAFGYLAKMTTPLSMIFTGVVLYDMGIKKLAIEKDVVLVMFGRFIVAPIIMFLLFYHVGGSLTVGLGRNVFILQSTLPVMLQCVIMSEYTGGDVEFATKSFAWTTIFSLITIPVFMTILTYLF